MSNRSKLFSFSLLFTLTIASGLLAKDNRPNILFIFSDDHAYQAISAYGSQVNKTPNLDRIANEGMRFDRCFVTNSICGPSRAVVLTGKYSHLNGFVRNGNTFNGNQQTASKLLQAAGYQTAVIGKWHLRSTPVGFDYYHVLQGQGPYYNPAMKTPRGIVNHVGYTTDIITDETLKWLKEERDSDKPFFLMYQHKAPHRNWQPGPKHLNKYDDVTISEPATLFDDYKGRTSAARNQEMTVKEHLTEYDLKIAPPRGLTEEQTKVWNEAYAKKNEEFKNLNLEGDDLIRWKYQRYVKDYIRCIDSVDENVGRVLDYLEESGLDENTIVIYTSDQGWYLGDHGWYDKRWMYEESFRTPLMVKWPGVVKPGSVSMDMSMNLDFAETFLDIAGADIPDDMQGLSLVEVLQGKRPSNWRKSVYYHYYEFPGAHSVAKHYGVRTDRYKLIHFYENEEWELFDLQKDPNELNSVYDDPAYQEIKKDMEAELAKLQEQYGDDGTVINFDLMRTKKVKTQLVQQFDFGKGNYNGTILDDEGKAIELDGSQPAFSAPSSEQNDPSYKPMLVGGWIKPTTKRGVIIAQGGVSQGYALLLANGQLLYVVRQEGQIRQLRGPQIPIDKWTHVAVRVDAEGNGELLVNGEATDAPKKVQFVGARPADGLSVGADSGSFVGNYQNPNFFKGRLRDVRVYWGKVSADVITDWTK